MTALSIALQGVGYAPNVLALQGFGAIEEVAAQDTSGGGTAQRKRPVRVQQHPQPRQAEPLTQFSEATPTETTAPSLQRRNAPEWVSTPQATAQQSALPAEQAGVVQTDIQASAVALDAVQAAKDALQASDAARQALQAEIGAKALTDAQRVADQKADNRRRAQILAALMLLH